MRKVEIVGPKGTKSWLWTADSIISEIPEIFREIGEVRVRQDNPYGMVTLIIRLHRPVNVFPLQGEKARGIVVDRIRSVCRVPGLGDTVYVAPLPREGDREIILHVSLKRCTVREDQVVTTDHIRAQLLRLVHLMKEGFSYKEEIKATSWKPLLAG